MKIFLCDFSSAEFIQAAAELKKRGAEILYWTGFKQAFLDAAANKKDYPNTIFHSIFDAVRGMPASGVGAEFSPPSLALIQEMLECESITISMMNRMDYTNMPYSQKKQLYYKYLQYWNGVINKFKPKAIVFSEIPHAVYNFVLYSLAKKQNIPTIMTASNNRNLMGGWLSLIKNYERGDENLFDEYKKIENEKHSIDELCPSFREYYKKIAASNAEAMPVFNKQQSARAKNRFVVIPSINAIIKNIRLGRFWVTAKGFIGSLLNFEKQVLTIDPEDDSHRGHLWQLEKIKRIKKELKKEYESLQSEADFGKKYIYCPLQFQPERTTSPMAGLYVDQILIVKTLAAAIPPEWIIYVKEYPLQWSQYSNRAHLSRYKGYYKELTSLKNVRLVPTELSSYKLIARAEAVATATGTAGWEALVQEKPVLLFGFPWYMYCDGIFLVDGVEKCRAALLEIIAGKKPNSQKVLNYFLAFQKTAIRTSQLARMSQLTSEISAEQAVNNLTEAIWGELKKIEEGKAII